jgi:hypothetical protein
VEVGGWRVEGGKSGDGSGEEGNGREGGEKKRGRGGGDLIARVVFKVHCPAFEMRVLRIDDDPAWGGVRLETATAARASSLGSWRREEVWAVKRRSVSEEG